VYVGGFKGSPFTKYYAPFATISGSGNSLWIPVSGPFRSQSGEILHCIKKSSANAHREAKTIERVLISSCSISIQSSRHMKIDIERVWESG